MKGTIYKTLEEEFEATLSEMGSVSIRYGDEVLYWDVNGDNECHVGIALDIEHFDGNFYEPPSDFYGVKKDDGTTEVFNDEFVLKRKPLDKKEQKIAIRKALRDRHFREQRLVLGFTVGGGK